MAKGKIIPLSTVALFQRQMKKLESRIKAAREQKTDLVLKMTYVTSELRPQKGEDSCLGIPATEELPQGGSLRQEEKEKHKVLL